METLSLLAASAAGLIAGSGASVWFIRRRATPVTGAPEAEPVVVEPDAATEEVVLDLDEDGRLASFQGPLEALVGPHALAGGGRGLARLRLQALRLQALRLRAEAPAVVGSAAGAAVRGDPIEGTGGPLVPEVEVRADGFRVTLRPAPERPTEVGAAATGDGSEAAIVSVMRDAPIGVIQLDDNARITAHNRFFGRLVGLDRADALAGTAFLDRVAPADRERVAAAM